MCIRDRIRIENLHILFLKLKFHILCAGNLDQQRARGSRGQWWPCTTALAGEGAAGEGAAPLFFFFLFFFFSSSSFSFFLFFSSSPAASSSSLFLSPLYSLSLSPSEPPPAAGTAAGQPGWPAGRAGGAAANCCCFFFFLWVWGDPKPINPIWVYLQPNNPTR